MESPTQGKQMGEIGMQTYRVWLAVLVVWSVGTMSAEAIARPMVAGLRVTGLVMQTSLTEMFPSWETTPVLFATTDLGPISIPPHAATWSSSAPSVASVAASGRITAIAAGTATITAVVDGVQAHAALAVKAPKRPPERGAVPSFLATPAADSLYEVRVVIIRYLPTVDGALLDVSFDPDFGALDPISLSAIKQRIDAMDINVKFMLEEGSRFRGYQGHAARPSIGYRVVDYVTFYEPTPQGKRVATLSGYPVYNADFGQILKRINAQHYVNHLGVTEFWLWSGGVTPDYGSYDPRIHTPEKLRENPESNMSSAVTGDISNSVRDPNDLPIYDHSYIVYSPTFRRSEAEAVHTRGHQYEAMLSYVNQRQDGNMALWWQTFVGRDANFQFVGGRCGDTHHPPNARADYDYGNLQPVTSDCEDWTPAGIGQKKSVSATTWSTLPYAWPQHVPTQQTESQWYIYWMQNMPGWGNVIPYGTRRMTNWWTFTANWDASITSNLGLYGPACAFSLSTTSLSISSEGGSSNVHVSSGEGCRWIVSSNADWIRIDPAGGGGQGAGTAWFTITPNTATTARTGTLVVAGQRVTMTQAGRTEPVPPSITTQPASQSIEYGHPATVHVGAVGTAPLTYQWYVGASGDSSRPIVGATTSRLITSTLTRTTSFWVRVSNAAGHVDSAAATITVQPVKMYLPLVRP